MTILDDLITKAHIEKKKCYYSTVCCDGKLSHAEFHIT